MIIVDSFLIIIGIIGAICCKISSKAYLGFGNKFDTYFWVCLIVAALGIIGIIKYFQKKQKHSDEIRNSNSQKNSINTKVCANCGMKNLTTDCKVCPKCGNSVE